MSINYFQQNIFKKNSILYVVGGIAEQQNNYRSVQRAPKADELDHSDNAGFSQLDYCRGTDRVQSVQKCIQPVPRNYSD